VIYIAQEVFKIVIFRYLQKVRHVVRMRRISNAYKILAWNLFGKHSFQAL